MYAIFILIAFICAQSIHAQAPPTVQQENGKPIIIKWSATHEGILKVLPQVSPVVSLPFRVHENLCATASGQTCVFKTQFSQPWAFLAWNKHPDPNKIGQIIKQKQSGEFLENEETIASEFKRFYPKISKELKTAAIECNDYSWIPDGTQKTAPNKLMISRWEMEFMLPNNETGISENRTISGALNIELTKNHNSLEIQKMKAITSGEFTTPTLVYGDNFSWTLKDTTGHSCQIAFKPGDISKVEKILNDMSFNRPDSKTVQPYILGTDELLNIPNGISDFSLSFWPNLSVEELE